jgi:hypothetical protein
MTAGRIPPDDLLLSTKAALQRWSGKPPPVLAVVGEESTATR